MESHFPPGVDFTPGGPLFGVQFSSLPCGDVKRPGSPLGIGGDPGGVPLYRDGRRRRRPRRGGRRRLRHRQRSRETLRPKRASRSPGPPASTRRRWSAPSEILADGIRLPYANAIGRAGRKRSRRRRPGSPCRGRRRRRRSSRPPWAASRDAPTRASRRAEARVLTAADVAAILDQAARPVGDDARRDPPAARLERARLDRRRGHDGRGARLLPESATRPTSASTCRCRRPAPPRFFSSAERGPRALRARARRLPGERRAARRPLRLHVARRGLPRPALLPAGDRRRGLGPVLGADRRVEPVRHGPAARPPEPRRQRGSCSAIARLPNGITIFPGGIPLFKDGRLAGRDRRERRRRRPGRPDRRRGRRRRSRLPPRSAPTSSWCAGRACRG